MTLLRCTEVKNCCPEQCFGKVDKKSDRVQVDFSKFKKIVEPADDDGDDCKNGPVKEGKIDVPCNASNSTAATCNEAMDQLPSGTSNGYNQHEPTSCPDNFQAEQDKSPSKEAAELAATADDHERAAKEERDLEEARRVAEALEVMEAVEAQEILEAQEASIREMGGNGGCDDIQDCVRKVDEAGVQNDKATVDGWLKANGFSRGVNTRRSHLLRVSYPLHAAVKQHDEQMVRKLLAAKASPNPRTRLGRLLCSLPKRFLVIRVTTCLENGLE